jgi:hypothetical protein
MADNKNKRTVYQNLNNFFNLDGFGFAPIQHDQDNNKVVIKGNSPEDIKRKGLEIEQRKKIQDKYFRTTDRGFQKALQYEAARLPAYIDYEGMEYYPIISSALDLFMEEATTIGPNGNMLNIYSNKDRIKYLLEEFFYDILNVNVNLPFWTRNVVKYGDNFVLLYGERKKGITHVKQMVNYEVERFERIQKGKPVVKFKERMTGDEFNVFEIAHFRLLGDDKYLPYGSSVLNKVRRVFRQLVMGEDAMLTYRIIRAGEKKVFKIDVGNIDEEDIEDYIYKVATKFKKSMEVSPNDGQIDYRFNILGNDEDYFIPVRNANVETGIDTLPGASNLDQIQDIEYLRDNLFTGLGIPKPFLSFQDAAGGGKNMAQYDIRFAKKINRIQQSMIQELNKMAMIHLYLLGYDKEDIGNFTLTLTNPSTQQEMLKAELFREKSQVYTELTRGENGIAAMSHTKAKRIVFNMSDREIVNDLKQQKMEKVVQQELADAPVVIKQSGIYSDIDKKYGEPELAGTTTGATGGEEGEAGGIPPEGGAAEGGESPEGGGEEIPFQSPTDLPPIEAESVNSKKIMSNDEYNKHVENIVYGDNKKYQKNKNEKKLIKENIGKNDGLNKKAEEMVNEIDSMLQESKKLNENDSTNIDNIDLDKLGDIDLKIDIEDSE